MFNPEEDPGYELTKSGEPWYMHRENCGLYTFFGRLAVHNHVFLIHSEDMGQHVWREEPLYDKLADFIIQNNFPQYLNANEVSESDKRAHMGKLTMDLMKNKSFPEEWAK